MSENADKPWWEHARLTPDIRRLYVDLDRIGETSVRERLRRGEWSDPVPRARVERWLSHAEQERELAQAAKQAEDRILKLREIEAVERAADAATRSADEARKARRIALWALGIAALAAAATAAQAIGAALT